MKLYLILSVCKREAQGYIWMSGRGIQWMSDPWKHPRSGAQGSEQPDGVENVSACAGIWERILNVPSSPNHDL